MTTTIADLPRAENLGELLEQLGNVPAWRIRLAPPPGHATESDLLEMNSRTDRICELIDGVLVEKAMGLRESFLAAWLIRILGAFVDSRGLGIVTGPDGPMRLGLGRVRMPDISFISWDQIPSGRVPSEPIPELHPDLAIEILSESNTVQEMELKRRDYFAAGTRLVWQIEPGSQTVEVFTAPDKSTKLDVAGTLNGGLVLPEFSLSIAELFGSLDRKPPPATQESV